MRFLCLPGAFNNAKTFEAQLKPLCDILESDESATFRFAEGNVLVEIPQEYAGFFGPPPNYAFFDVNNREAIHKHIRHFPRGETPESSLRSITKHSVSSSFESVRSALDYLIQLLDKEPDIDGVIGYSEGARVAASLILDERQRQKDSGRTPHLKCAIFIGGWQPVHPVSGGDVYADETEERIEVHTCHVLGSNDPYIDASLALYNLCDQDRADLFDHGAGHVLPREKAALEDLADVVRNMITDANEGS
ncbi:hypothetical protein SI65_07415 [Aspergillus cristatus]|uniref:Serine hydrolase domain-containing protein n=1 Tax=Aspergillus cristatus TaxID=573508 RepID=A0A1E3B9D5_ASPCR|nr:hypothetical protein SI65_07415 [Aspergillus cristatus]